MFRTPAAPSVHGPEGMNTQKLEESSRLVAATSWGAIAAGVFVALALQTLLLLMGLALGLSVGDRTVSGGYTLWAVLVQLGALAVGAALAARVARADTRLGGMVAGAMTWAVTIVLGGLGGLTLASVAMIPGATSGAWAAFLGILLGLGAAVLGGAFGASLGRARMARPGSSLEARTTERTAQPPMVEQPVAHPAGAPLGTPRTEPV